MFRLTDLKTYIALLITLVLVSCADKDLSIQGGSEIEGEDPESVELRFGMLLDQDLSGRADEPNSAALDNIDNYVNLSMVEVLFFDSKGQFLFEPKGDQLDIQPSPDNNGQWYVTVKLRSGFSDSGGSISLSAIKSQLEKEEFKIAVLANWTSNTKAYSLPWTLANSSLNTSATDIKNINDLHHLEKDSEYSNAAFSFLVGEGNTMGVRSEWVKSKKNLSEASADTWIRENYDPSITYSDNDFLKRYPNIWQVYNLGGSYENTAIPYSQVARDDKDNTKYLKNEKDKVWQSKNGNKFKDWLREEDGIELTESFNSPDNNIDGFYFSASDATEVEGQKGVVSTAYHKDNYHGVALGRSNYFEKTETDGVITSCKLKLSSSYTKGFIKFTAPATGKLRILWSSDTEDTDARFVIQRGTTFEKIVGPYNSTTPIQFYEAISINQDPEDIYIYNISDQSKVVIYAIEYICDKYLYDTDREGIEPREDNPIPMYGVQNFNKIDNWGSVDILNLSQSGKYVNLVRALAKVELYLKDQAKHVFMRSMNRKARCEPMDVETPTINGFSKFTGIPSIHDKNHCEWFDILEYGAAYSKVSNKQITSPTTADYQNWLSWFYGSWVKKRNSSGTYIDKGASDWKWDWNSKPITLPGLLTDASDYPHIFNPDIQRSDFCEFIYKGQEDGMHKYILYVPDKNIDDPNKTGEMGATPKVMHIEYRYEANTDYLDDNSCYRIYFTDYSTNQEIKKVYMDQFDNFESNKKFISKDEDGKITTENHDYLKDLWPVMRNHVYRFYVGRNNETQEIRVSVTDFNSSPDPKKEVW